MVVPIGPGRNIPDIPNTPGRATPGRAKKPTGQSVKVSSSSVQQPPARDPWGVTDTRTGITQWTDGQITYDPPRGGGYGGYDPGYVAPPAIDYSKLDDDALGGYDDIFQAQLAALRAALSNQLSDFTARRSQYDVDMSEALRKLGISGQIFDDPTTPDVDESTPGQWMWRDLNTVAGRANHNLKNDYASRGILQSSLFGDALTNLHNSLNDQVADIGNARSSFLSDLARQQVAAEEENRAAINNARAEALFRLVHGITL